MPTPKPNLHPRNKNNEKYDLKALQLAVLELKKHIKPNKFGNDSIDFSNPKAVKLLNQALLKYYYGIDNWNFPNQNLCPPIPGRADYLHHIADLLGECNDGKIPEGNKITGLDIGTGASLIYPIIGVCEYQWNFIATDINPKSIISAQKIVRENPSLNNKIECRTQPNSTQIFNRILSTKEKIDFTMCNPPFHASEKEAEKGSRRKAKNLSGKKVKNPTLNFAGISNELIYNGGEIQFIKNMIQESKNFGDNCMWFSTLVSKQSNLKEIYYRLKKTNAAQFTTINTSTTNKASRIVAWTFLTSEEQKVWKEEQWQ